MDFPKEIKISFNSSGISNVPEKTIRIHGGITTLLGPNGSGKTQILRSLKQSLSSVTAGKKVRYVSAGRLGPLENYRSDYDGQRGGQPRYDDAQYGDKRSVKRRHKNETVLGDFASLSERPDILIKVQERLKKLFRRDLRVDWDGGHLRVFFIRTDVSSNDYSSAREASGLLHLVACLSALYDDEIGCLLIDEPEVSLHPQLQAFLYQEMMKVAGSPVKKSKKLIFISTHSTEFVHVRTVDDLASIVFCSDIYSDPVQIDPRIDEFRSRKIKALLSRMGQEHKLALFCGRPLLVEGPSDQIVCSGLSLRLELNTEAAGSQILPVTGKGQMPVVIKLMRLIGKVPSVLADADALADGLDLVNCFTNSEAADEIAVAKGHRSAADLARDTYRDFCKLVEDHWNDIEGLAVLHKYWIDRDTERDEIVARRRSSFSTLLGTNVQELSAIENSSQWIGMRTRIEYLLEFLASLGCFILRKGTIEAYYLHANHLTSDEKPNAASHEISYFDDMKDDELESNYADIVAAVRFAAQAKGIDEGAAIRNLVLAVITPALASLTTETTAVGLTSASKSMFGNMADLFVLKVENAERLTLVIDLATEILDVEGFPLSIPVGENPIALVNKQMRIRE